MIWFSTPPSCVTRCAQAAIRTNERVALVDSAHEAGAAKLLHACTQTAIPGVAQRNLPCTRKVDLPNELLNMRQGGRVREQVHEHLGRHQVGAARNGARNLHLVLLGRPCEVAINGAEGAVDERTGHDAGHLEVAKVQEMLALLRRQAYVDGRRLFSAEREPLAAAVVCKRTLRPPVAPDRAGAARRGRYCPGFGPARRPCRALVHRAAAGLVRETMLGHYGHRTLLVDKTPHSRVVARVGGRGAGRGGLSSHMLLGVLLPEGARDFSVRAGRVRWCAWTRWQGRRGRQRHGAHAAGRRAVSSATTTTVNGGRRRRKIQHSCTGSNRLGGSR